jgi:hypothetical protein
MANEDLINRKTFCTVCTNEVPAERLRFRSVTCSDEHAAIRQRMLRKRVDDRVCRFCHKPSTPTQRKAFTRFRKWERDNPTLAYPQAWEIVKAAGISEADFGKAVHQSVKHDIQLDPEMALLEWGTVKRRKEDDKPTPQLDQVLDVLLAHAKARMDAIEHVATAQDEEVEHAAVA